MIPLDSLEWKSLRHAYGSAEDIPPLLKTISKGPSKTTDSEIKDTWFKLWSALCHQGDVYTASIAAVPHLMKIALDADDGALVPDLILLPIAIEESRMKTPEQIPGHAIEESYWAAILDLEEACRRARESAKDHQLISAIHQAMKLLNGRPGRKRPSQNENLGALFRLDPLSKNT